ncbi:SDR family NAD(P)-dependent oxidoreductase [Pedobacter frigiditerrae]|uniref:SDR family NAD(P)-dependent oxidoreductase n=1 Tax=Pedobacter frigiditerrae TaxID=2530452 RepID=A0A4R0MP73_9SPHI|nr:SDR family oxidoreductase [Pedobacter frigiditerrae]TCC88631.1 SDR family NAD(P)-dependent oxidoreductase [Pedobacter frigiditerrae]
MNITNNTILITGGATGIGLELAKQFIANGNTVIICGRRENKLREAKNLLPALITKQCDISDIEKRRELYGFCMAQFPSVNILVNNAGIQREIDFRKGETDYLNGPSETAINLDATFHLTALFTPHFMKHKESAIINVSSGLGIVPLVIVPIYSATKSALHSFSISLRKQLKATTVKVFEILPPIVDTELDNGARDKRGQTDKGISAEKVAVESLKAIGKDIFEIPIGIVKVLRIGSRINPKLFLKIINKKSPVQTL